MKDVDGIELNDNLKNEVLSKVLEVKEDGDSVFYDEVFSDPSNIFKAAFWYYYGPSVMQQYNEYWKKEKSAAYKRGMEAALGKQQPPVSFSSKQGDETNNSDGYVAPEDISDLDELHLTD
jgi:hypothetical protein